MVAPAFASGVLRWDSQRVEVVAKTTDKSVAATFHFVNAGASAVTITTIQPGCGCTTAELAKRLYAPGEAGEIKAVYTIGDASGHQEKTINVGTDESPNLVTTLRLSAEIPERFTYSTRMLLWRTAEVPVEKAVIITNVDTQKITAVEPASEAGDVISRLEPLESGSRYRIWVQPRSLAHAMNAPVAYHVRFADNSTKSVVIYAVVR